MNPIAFTRLFRPVAVLALSACAVPALADCPPLGTLPGFELQKEESGPRHYEEYRFRIGDEYAYEEQVVAGRYCQAIFVSPSDHMTVAEVMRNYREQLAQLGAETTFRSREHLFARLDENGQETWLHVFAEERRLEHVVVTKTAHQSRLTAPSGDDHRLFGHMPGYGLESAERRKFDEITLPAVGDEGKEIGVEGAVYVGRYVLLKDSTPASITDIVENYRHAILSRGGEEVARERRHLIGRLIDNDTVVWVHLYAEQTQYELTVVEEKPFESSLRPPKADALRAALDKQGRVALYVNFDFAKATLRPDAEPVLAQVVELLKADPALKLTIEGHTDDVGSDEANLKLSAARAAAVVDALVAKGIARERLESVGYGESRPIADNATAEGRAKNRRVELVKR